MGLAFNPAGLMYSAIMFLSVAGVSLFFWSLATLERVKSSIHTMKYLVPHRLIAGMLRPKFTKKVPALLVERVFIGFSTPLRHAFALEQAMHGIIWPVSFTQSCFTLYRVISSMG